MKAFPNMTNEKGMDLRDYFATHALPLAKHLLIPNDIAKRAYQIADAMMKVREGK
jgi:hypothetical protein